MKILITGAHFTPAQAVIEELKKHSDIEIAYVGRGTTIEGDRAPSVESQVLPTLGVKFYPIMAGRLRRFLSLGTIISLLKIPVGFVQSFFIVLKEQPSVVLSFGGYVGVPVVVSAWFLNIPIIVHEQTLVTGLANKISNFFATKIAVSFKKEYGFSKEKLVLTGNPIRRELLQNNVILGSPSTSLGVNSATPESGLVKVADVDSGQAGMTVRAKKEKLPVIYITGGNQGSHIINNVVSKSLEELTKNCFVIHQTGDSKYQDFEKLSEQGKSLKNPERYLVQKWFGVSEVAEIYREVDLVISRAGANTMYELSYFGIPTLVIPVPYLYADEQNVNAKFFKENGLCQILSQSSLNEKNFLERVKEMLKNREKLRDEAKLAKSVIVLDAARKLTVETLTLAEKNV